MKGKISQFLSRFSLYDTTGLAKETRKNLRLVILGVVIGNVSFTITGYRIRKHNPVSKRLRNTFHTSVLARRFIPLMFGFN